MPIKAVIFDYGKVLSLSEDPAAQKKLIALSRLDRPEFDKHYWGHRHNYDLGVLDGRSYWDAIGRDAGLDYAPHEIAALIETDILMWTSLNERMLAWVVALQAAGFRTAILSNMGFEILGYMRQEFGWLSNFQHHTWSCELGMAKPDPGIYLYTCDKLEVKPEESIFLDDKVENITAASSVGLNAVLFSTIEKLNGDLAERGFDPLLPPLPE